MNFLHIWILNKDLRPLKWLEVSLLQKLMSFVLSTIYQYLIICLITFVFFMDKQVFMVLYPFQCMLEKELMLTPLVGRVAENLEILNIVSRLMKILVNLIRETV